jgi:hypothetical protein
MKKKSIYISIFAISLVAILFISWGPTGHRTTAAIAENHLDRKARKQIAKILDGASLAEVSTFADEIKSDKNFRRFGSWHYVNYPKGGSYATAPKNPKGDIIVAIDSCISVLKNEKSSKVDKAFYLKMLIHLVGDIHQPLHIGHKKDKGGNTIQVLWHGKKTNIHHVWDIDMIEQWNMSYSELVENIDLKLSKKEIETIQKGSVLDWTIENRKITDEIYNSVKSGDKLGYNYSYKYMGTVKNQLQKGGLRLAKILNDIW